MSEHDLTFEVNRVRHQARGLCYMEFGSLPQEVTFCPEKATWVVLIHNEYQNESNGYQMCDAHRQCFIDLRYPITREEMIEDGKE